MPKLGTGGAIIALNADSFVHENFPEGKPLDRCFPKWAVPPPWGRSFDIRGWLSLFLNTYFLYNIVVFTLKKKSYMCLWG